MTSWQRRMEAVDRRFSHHASVSDHPSGRWKPPDEAPEGREADEPAVAVAPSIALADSPGTAARLAALLREDQRAAHDRRVVLAGTAS
jgi:hypothetical protein